MTTSNGPMPDTLDAGDDPPSEVRRRRRGVRVTSAAAVALGLALAGGSAAAAATTSAPSPSAPSPSTSSPSTSSSSGPPPGRPLGGSPPAAVGTVKSVGEGSFTVTTSGGTTVTVDVSSSTKYLDHDVTTPSLANVTVGQHVAVFGTDTSDVVTATAVAIGAPPNGGPGGMPSGPGGPGGGSPPAAVGTVKSVGDGSFTVTTSGGTTVTVDASSSTKYLDHDVTTPSLANVTVGQHVAVFGTDTSDVVTATAVAIGAPPSGGPPSAPGGTSGSRPPAWSGSSPSS